MSKLAIRDLHVRVGHGPRAFDAVDGVSLTVPEGAIVGLVGESGSGKSTLARAIVRLTTPESGEIVLGSHDYARASGRRLAELRRRVQMVFQDPRSSLNPRMTVGDAIREGVTTHRRTSRQERAAEVRRLLELVQLDPALAASLPGTLSGGQRQRVALARALAVRPDVIVADEITASLDVSVQAAVLNLLRDLRREIGLSLLVISHNLAIVRYLSDEVVVMQLGRAVERGPATDVVERPQHPYTRTLIEAAELDDLDRTPAPLGEAPDPLAPPSGCRYRTICPVGPETRPERTICASDDPCAVVETRLHRTACHFAAVAGEERADDGR